jgi:hypothetical protein
MEAASREWAPSDTMDIGAEEGLRSASAVVASTETG